MVLGGALSALLVTDGGINTILAIVIATAAVAALGGLTFLLAVRPALQRGEPPMTLTIITLAVAFLIAALALRWLGPDPLHMPTAGGDEPYRVLGAAVAKPVVWILAVSALTMAALNRFFNVTRAGQAMLATNADKMMASLVGVNVGGVVLVSFVLGAALAGLAGALVVPLTSVTVFAGLNYTLKGFAAAVFGGLGKSVGAVVGGLLLGLIEAYSGGLISTAYRDFIAFGVILLMLMFRPSGLLGARLQ